MTTVKTFIEPKRRRVNKEDRRVQILEVAGQLFSFKGFNGTTTKEIAEKVGVSEAIIFRHFPSKQDLYSAILDYKSNACLQQMWSTCEKYMQKKDDKGVFLALAIEILETHKEDPTLMRLLYYSALEGHQLAKSFFETTAVKARERIATYINQRIEDGAFRKVNPVLTARSFFSLIHNRAVVRELFQDSQLLKISSKETALELTNLFLHGITNHDSSID